MSVIIGQDRQVDARQTKYPFVDACSCRIGNSVFGPDYIHQLILYIPHYAKLPVYMTRLQWLRPQHLLLTFQDSTKTFLANAKIPAYSEHQKTICEIKTPDGVLSGLVRVSELCYSAVLPSVRAFHNGIFIPQQKDFQVSYACCRPSVSIGVHNLDIFGHKTTTNATITLLNNLVANRDEDYSPVEFSAYTYLPVLGKKVQTLMVQGIPGSFSCTGKHIFINNKISSDIRVAVTGNKVQVGGLSDF